jgi:hypothetical protein
MSRPNKGGFGEPDPASRSDLPNPESELGPAVESLRRDAPEPNRSRRDSCIKSMSNHDDS